MKCQAAKRAISSGSRPAASRSVSRATTSVRYESSTSTPEQPSTSWKPVLAPGQNAAYDAALSFLDAHKADALARLEKLRSMPSTPRIAAEIRNLEVSSLVNDPATRRLFRQTGGEGLMDRPVMRHLARRRWEKEGGLDRLMQRVEQLDVVPDLLGSVTGSLPIRFTVNDSEEVEPGSPQAASSFTTPPTLHVQVLDDTEEGLYTLLMVDPDSPNHETQSFAQRLHYLKSDIPLTVQSGQTDLFSSDLGKEQLAWEPPLPPKGSGTHRYVFFLLRQPQSTTTLSPPTSRTDFDLRSLLSDGHAVSAVTLFRSKWTPAENSYIEETYRQVHGSDIPVFEKAPKELKYGMPMSKRAREREEQREVAWNQALVDMVGEAGVEEIKVEGQ